MKCVAECDPRHCAELADHLITHSPERVIPVPTQPICPLKRGLLVPHLLSTVTLPHKSTCMRVCRCVCVCVCACVCVCVCFCVCVCTCIFTKAHSVTQAHIHFSGIYYQAEVQCHLNVR